MTFVTIEGLDGSGKDTALDAIEEQYPDAVFTTEPSDLDTGQMVRQRLSDEDSHPLEDFYLFMADRVNHIDERVRPVDEDGGLVVSGRYSDSTRAYQPVALSNAGVFESQWQAKDFIEKTMLPWDYEPDMTLYLEISVDTALERCTEEEKYEKREFLEQVKKNYTALAASSERIITIDAERSPEEVASEVTTLVGTAVDAPGAVEGW